MKLKLYGINRVDKCCLFMLKDVYVAVADQICRGVEVFKKLWNNRVDSENGQNLDKWTKLKKSLLPTKLSTTSSIKAKNHHLFFC